MGAVCMEPKEGEERGGLWWDRAGSLTNLEGGDSESCHCKKNSYQEGKSVKTAQLYAVERVSEKGWEQNTALWPTPEYFSWD